MNVRLSFVLQIHFEIQNDIDNKNKTNYKIEYLFLFIKILFHL